MNIDVQIKETERVMLKDSQWWAHEALILGNQLAIMRTLKNIESRLPTKLSSETGPG